MAQLNDQQDSTHARLSSQEGAQEACTEIEYIALASELINQATETGSNFVSLLGAELKLAMSDAIRLFMLSKIFTQLGVYCWLGFSVFVAWLVFDVSAYGPWSALTFTALQITALLIIQFVMSKLKRSLTLPMTRAQLSAFGVSGHDKTQEPSK